MKAIHVMHALLLQKPSILLGFCRNSAKYHLKALERRLRFWEEGSITELVNKSKTMQEKLPSTIGQINIEKLSFKFKQLMQKSNVNGALRLLINNMSNRILPLSNETLQILSLKHPEAQQAHHEAMLQVPKRQIHSIVYEAIDKYLVKKAAIKSKGCAHLDLMLIIGAESWFPITLAPVP